MRGLVLFNGLLLTALAHGAQAQDNSFWQDAQAGVLARNYFLHNDYRNDRVREQNYSQEWAQGFIGHFNSGFTSGNVGLGIDAHGFFGLRLDSGRGTAGTGLLPLDSDGRAEPDYSSAGAALKLRLGATQLRVGEMEVETPVFDTADKRLQPEYATGWLLDSLDVPGVRLVAGRFTAFKNQNQSTGRGDLEGYGASTAGQSISLAGIESRSDQALGGALYIGELSDTWRQYYGNLHGGHLLGPQTRFDWDANLYRTLDSGQASAGAIANTAASLLLKLTHARQAFSFGYQKIHGDTPFDFVGGDSIYLANSIKYNDFNGPGEQSFQARYDLDLGDVFSGLSFMGRYVRGSGIDGTDAPRGGAYNRFAGAEDRYVPLQGKGGRHWERDLTLAYKVPAGALQGLSVELSYVTHRGNAAQGNNDLDRLYVVVQYPLDILR
ncbi:outer membrane porin [Pseudomonas sp. StFLB209]|uniref:OprD family outer membrane porin n=1 Tax=Pseudomonas sp. StFLB209 TaxID=1028989 RepID=UPI0004F74FF2|nr:OprD family outer membrane porin [Pseudomonas sp. StFLB209]BAP40919.1 outer membrane porin [Pseudomonas sp. StFLB209]